MRRFSTLRWLAATFLVIGLTDPVHARGASPQARGASKPAPVAVGIAIDNFGRVDATYYRGSQPEGQDYAALAALGVKTVIDLTSDDADPAEPGSVQRAGMRYVKIPMTVHTAPTAAQQSTFLGLVTEPQNQPVFVHCVGGRHRTGVMTALYRMTADGWTADQAFKEMKQYRFGPDFLHSEFKAFVFAFRGLPTLEAGPANTSRR